MPPVAEKPETLTVRPYTAEDYDLVNGWFESHKKRRSRLPEDVLPPNGVIVEGHDGPLCALWVFETVGSPLAILDWPVSRPGIGAARAIKAFRHAVAALMNLAGKIYDTPGTYTLFMGIPGKGTARVLERMGFDRAYDDERIPMVYDTRRVA